MIWNNLISERGVLLVSWVSFKRERKREKSTGKRLLSKREEEKELDLSVDEKRERNHCKIYILRHNVTLPLNTSR